MKLERDKTTHVSTCTDLQLQVMEDRDTAGLRKKDGGWGWVWGVLWAGGFAWRDCKAKTNRQKQWEVVMEGKRDKDEWSGEREKEGGGREGKRLDIVI